MTTNNSSTIEELVIYFKSIEGYFTGEKKMYDFIKSETGNHSLDKVMTKVAAIGNPSMWENGGQASMAAHIYSLHIDDRLKNGDLRLVEDICNFKAIHNYCMLYHFASKYCCFHYPNLFPIYCSSGHRLVNTLRPGMCKDILNHYECYAEMIETIKEEFRLASLNYLELNKFLWLYEQQLFNSASLSIRTQ